LLNYLEDKTLRKTQFESILSCFPQSFESILLIFGRQNSEFQYSFAPEEGIETLATSGVLSFQLLFSGGSFMQVQHDQHDPSDFPSAPVPANLPGNVSIDV
jgi:hypothetical protein